MERILVSACLLGRAVRFDGRAKTINHEIVARWRDEGRLVPFCPEVVGGLPVPRPRRDRRRARGPRCLSGTSADPDPGRPRRYRVLPPRRPGRPARCPRARGAAGRPQGEKPVLWGPPGVRRLVHRYDRPGNGADHSAAARPRHRRLHRARTSASPGPAYGVGDVSLTSDLFRAIRGCGSAPVRGGAGCPAWHGCVKSCTELAAESGSRRRPSPLCSRRPEDLHASV